MELESEITIEKHGDVPTDAEMDLLFASSSLGGTQPAVFSLLPHYSEQFIAKFSLPNFRKPLLSLKQTGYIDLGYDKLLTLCGLIVVEVTAEMSEAVERETRPQSHSRLWFTYRAGRVTASNMKSVCHTNPGNSSQSLIKAICYPEEFRFYSKQTTWGVKREKKAQQLYLKFQKHGHIDLCIAENGLVINPRWPFIGASPDGIVSCGCYETRVLEIKCPYSHRFKAIRDAVLEDKSFCHKEVDGLSKLDHSYAYYYQIQTQLFVCGLNSCDFSVCTFVEDDKGNGLHIEHIYKDQRV